MPHTPVSREDVIALIVARGKQALAQGRKDPAYQPTAECVCFHLMEIKDGISKMPALRVEGK